jgi:hypothetical protein
MTTNAELLNELGVKLTEMDYQLGAATERLGVGDINGGQFHVSKAHAMLGVSGKALADLAKAILGASVPPPIPEPELKFNGPVSPNGLNSLDFAYYQKQGMGMRVNQVINGTLSELNNWIGRVYEDSKKYQAEPFRTELDNYNGPLKGL